jgi:hypothetical protein
MPAKKTTTASKKRVAAEPIALPVPLNKWYADHENVEQLRLILENPRFRAACATLRQQIRPTGSSLVASENALAIRHAYVAGFYDFEDQLQQLTVLPTDRINTPEWDYVTPQ